ncbi:MAG TPA: TonB-dependent receptor [Ferruginibacter sp.]|nr:TonB-dependent receptor [Ferruginibacter sp.]
MKKFTFLLFAALCLSWSAQAQTISGKVKAADGKALSKATVSLLNAKDSTVAKFGVTDANGAYTIPLVKSGKYLTSTSFVGYKTTYSDVFEVAGADVKLPEVVLSATSGKDLAEVQVVAKKPMIEVKADKTILNVEGSINAVGQDALELLRKSPGVLVDKDDNLSLSGKNGVQVYVDGKPSPLSGTDLSAYLKTLQSNQIEAIEIITNPSAKYDAAGNAGIINIRLKKNKTFGTNGSINAGFAQGIYPKANGGISLNHRNKKINVFGNYNYNYTKNQNIFRLYRDLFDTIFNNNTKGLFRNQTHSFKTGLDYFIDKKSTIGVMVNGNFSTPEFNNYSETPIIHKPTGTVDRILIADNVNSNTRNNANFNLNYRYVDSKSRELSLDADYGLYRINSDQLQPNFYYDASGNNFLNSFIYNMIAPTDIDIYSLKGDYESEFKKGKLGIGFKTSYVKTGNDFQRYNVYTSDKILDTLRSNDFNYTENINAFYVNYNKQFKGFMVQFGLRMENTNAKGISNGFKILNGGYHVYDSTFTRNYTNLFPSAAITFNKNPTSQWSLSFSRRIDRPAYQDLNPFEFKLDEYTYQKGNTELLPQYTNSISLTNTYKYKLTTTLTYSHVYDVFSQIVDTAEKTKSFITKKNLATQDIVSLNVSYPFQYKWYSAFANFNGYYSHYKADFGGDSRVINLDVFAFNIYMQHSAKLGKGFSAELSGWYNSPSIWQGTFKSKEMWSVDVGVQKQFMGGKINAKISGTDIFFTQKWRGESNFAGQLLIASGQFESRQVRLNVTYRFGSTQVKAARQRKTGLDEENKRVGSQGGGLSGK